MTFVSRLDRAAIAELVEKAAQLAQPRSELQAYRAHGGTLSATGRAHLTAAKASAVATGDQHLAAAAWILETIATAQTAYVEAVEQCRQDHYYDAWVAFERAEIQLSFLAYHFDDAADRYGVAFMLEHIPRFQSLFPYTAFFSPGFIKKKVLCSICGHHVTPRKTCGHRVFDLYDGEMCGRRIAESVIMEISFVKTPVQKYSVLFTTTPYNYGKVHYVVSRLASAWDGWHVRTETRRFTNEKYLQPPFARCAPNAPCPCGSLKKFKKCCAGKKTHEALHCIVIFDVEPPPGVSLADQMICRHSVNDPLVNAPK
ncbi:SEC-C metal-binding domain-containing protein [Hyalangium gracile]|uniref:SEC-C metal-binding domain-containing protein n=1 Tax=Hyalangium gracile TaxID=394092 RepID=UPI001CC95195|nr:SEC-C metal-binding domain-containing protein [Hyalangium gracile]